jgi:hypothetical protein
VVEKSYVQIVDAKNRIRVRFKKYRGRIVEFVVQYETLVSAQWQPVIRYDTAHGSPHTDVMKPDGTRGKKITAFSKL